MLFRSVSQSRYELKAKMKSGASKKSLRFLDARKSLVIQIPWSWEPTSYERGGVTFTLASNGRLERRRRQENGQGEILGVDDFFAEIAKHFPKVTDTEIFDEIRLTDLQGRVIVRFIQNRDRSIVSPEGIITEGIWRIFR